MVKGLTLWAKTPEKHIKYIFDWMLEDERDTEIPHFVADNVSWLYPVDPKKINCPMLLRDNKSLASAILDIVEQMQKMEQILRDYCQSYVPRNNPPSEAEERIDELFTDAVNVSNRCSAETLQLPRQVCNLPG